MSDFPDITGAFGSYSNYVYPVGLFAQSFPAVGPSLPQNKYVDDNILQKQSNLFVFDTAMAIDVNENYKGIRCRADDYNENHKFGNIKSILIDNTSKQTVYPGFPGPSYSFLEYYDFELWVWFPSTNHWVYVPAGYQVLINVKSDDAEFIIFMNSFDYASHAGSFSKNSIYVKVFNYEQLPYVIPHKRARGERYSFGSCAFVVGNTCASFSKLNNGLQPFYFKGYSFNVLSNGGGLTATFLLENTAGTIILDVQTVSFAGVGSLPGTLSCNMEIKPGETYRWRIAAVPAGTGILYATNRYSYFP